MDLFTYLMAKNNQNTHKDLFSYLLGKGSGGGGTYTTYTGTSLNISNTIKAKIKNFMLNSTELTQDGTPSPDNPVDVNVITGSNNIKINQNLAQMYKNNIISNYALTSDGWEAEEGDYVIYIPCESYTQYEIYKVQSERLRIATTIENPATRPQIYQFYNSSDTTYASITTNNEAKYLCIFFRRFSDTLTMQEILDTMNVYETSQEQNYPITLSSKNLFNINGDVNTRYNGQTGNYNSVENNKLTATYSTNDGYPYGQRIYVGTGKKVTISGIVSNINSTRSKSALIMCFNDNTTTGVQSVTFDNTEINTRKSFSFTANTDYIIVAFSGRFSGFISATFTDIQVEYGETATTYMPYIANPIEYCKIGDYADQIFKNTTNSPYYDNTLIENEWYLKKNIGKIDSYNGETITTPYISTTGGLDTGATVYYGLETPTYIHISQEDYPTLKGQLDNLYNNAESYDEQTNITQTNDDLPFNISVDVKVANL